MVSDALREVMLRADGVGSLEGPDVISVVAEHPVCGDTIELSLRVVDGRIVDLAWRASGCPATMAVAAAARGALVVVDPTGVEGGAGVRLAAAEGRMRSRLHELGGLAATEQHALAMLLRALAKVSAP